MIKDDNYDKFNLLLKIFIEWWKKERRHNRYNNLKSDNRMRKNLKYGHKRNVKYKLSDDYKRKLQNLKEYWDYQKKNKV